MFVKKKSDPFECKNCGFNQWKSGSGLNMASFHKHEYMIYHDSPPPKKKLTSQNVSPKKNTFNTNRKNNSSKSGTKTQLKKCSGN